MYLVLWGVPLLNDLRFHDLYFIWFILRRGRWNCIKQLLKWSKEVVQMVFFRYSFPLAMMSYTVTICKFVYHWCIMSALGPCWSDTIWSWGASKGSFWTLQEAWIKHEVKCNNWAPNWYLQTHSFSFVLGCFHLSNDSYWRRVQII